MVYQNDYKIFNYILADFKHVEYNDLHMRSILLCVDGSEYSVSAAKYAISLSKLMNAYVDVLYASDLKKFEMSAIADFGGSIGVQPFQEMLSSVTSLENEKAQLLEKKFSKIFSDAGLTDKFKFNHRTGIISDTFDEFKNDVTGLDFIIIGKRGESSETAEERIGETVDTILRTSDCPCLIAPKKYSNIKKILIAYDGSESATKALHFLERNSCFSNCEIHLLSIEPDKELKESIKSAQEILSRIAGLKVVVSQKRSGEASDIIAKYAKENSIDLLMIGSFSHSIIRHFLIGSTTIDILEKTPTAMLVFK